jgi:hypothetical protein
MKLYGSEVLNDKRLCMEVKSDIKLPYILPFFFCSGLPFYFLSSSIYVIYLLLSLLVSLLSMFLYRLSFICPLFFL